MVSGRQYFRLVLSWSDIGFATPSGDVNKLVIGLFPRSSRNARITWKDTSSDSIGATC
jgi:hypothetical protein